MTWTEERVELLRKLWREGRSAAQVAAALGPDTTRNAVIGKIHRLGLADRSAAASAGQIAPRAKAAKTARTSTAVCVQPNGAVIGNVALAVSPQVAIVADPVEENSVVVPITTRVSLIDLRETMCRWPLGDPSSPDFRFCGVKSLPGSGPYCHQHAAIAYQPAQERRRRELPHSLR